MSIPTDNMNSSDVGEYAYQQISLAQSTDDNKDAEARRARHAKRKEIEKLEKLERNIKAYYDKHGAERSVTGDKVEATEQATFDKLEELEITETQHRRPSLVVILRVRAGDHSGQWCKV